MTLEPIQNEADYEKTLKEIEALWDAPVDTPAGQRLDELVDLVVAYEDEHYPIPPEPPAKTAPLISPPIE